MSLSRGLNLNGVSDWLCCGTIRTRSSDWWLNGAHPVLLVFHRGGHWFEARSTGRNFTNHDGSIHSKSLFPGRSPSISPHQKTSFFSFVIESSNDSFIAAGWPCWTSSEKRVSSWVVSSLNIEQCNGGDYRAHTLKRVHAPALMPLGIVQREHNRCLLTHLNLMIHKSWFVPSFSSQLSKNVSPELLSYHVYARTGFKGEPSLCQTHNSSIIVSSFVWQLKLGAGNMECWLPLWMFFVVSVE